MSYNLIRKSPVPEKVPESMQNIIDILNQSKDKEECLKKAYDIMTRRYKGYMLKTYLRFLDLFEADAGRLWARTGFLHCTQMNYLMRILLVKSRHFLDSDISLKWTLFWISPHQYLSINMADKEIDIDIWGQSRGAGFGEHASGFC